MPEIVEAEFELRGDCPDERPFSPIGSIAARDELLRAKESLLGYQGPGLTGQPFSLHVSVEIVAWLMCIQATLSQ